MIPIEVTILGSNSAIPAHGRHPTAQWIHMDGYHVLMDCGEGTQMRIQNSPYRPLQLDAVCISHLHGDHVFGLPGLMTTMALQGRQKMLNLYGPVGLHEYLKGIFKLSGSRFTYPWTVHEHSPEGAKVIFESEHIEIETFPLIHRIPTNGYLFKLKERPRRLNGTLLDQNHVPNEARAILKRGMDYTDQNGKTYSHEQYSSPGDPMRSYAFCSDTKYNEALEQILHRPNALYHEATYKHDMYTQAHERFHSTAKEAAMVAQMIGAKKLLLGHASSRYRDLSELEKEAQDIFVNSEYVIEGKKYLV